MHWLGLIGAVRGEHPGVNDSGGARDDEASSDGNVTRSIDELGAKAFEVAKCTRSRFRFHVFAAATLSAHSTAPPCIKHLLQRSAAFTNRRTTTVGR